MKKNTSPTLLVEKYSNFLLNGKWENYKCEKSNVKMEIFILHRTVKYDYSY